jgi:hypothetical protein
VGGTSNCVSHYEKRTSSPDRAPIKAAIPYTHPLKKKTEDCEGVRRRHEGILTKKKERTKGPWA